MTPISSSSLSSSLSGVISSSDSSDIALKLEGWHDRADNYKKLIYRLHFIFSEDSSGVADPHYKQCNEEEYFAIQDASITNPIYHLCTTPTANRCYCTEEFFEYLERLMSKEEFDYFSKTVLIPSMPATIRSPSEFASITDILPARSWFSSSSSSSCLSSSSSGSSSSGTSYPSSYLSISSYSSSAGSSSLGSSMSSGIDSPSSVFGGFVVSSDKTGVDSSSSSVSFTSISPSGHGVASFLVEPDSIFERDMITADVLRRKFSQPTETDQEFISRIFASSATIKAMNIRLLKDEDQFIFFVVFDDFPELGIIYAKEDTDNILTIWARDHFLCLDDPKWMFLWNKGSGECFCASDFLPHVARVLNRPEYERFLKLVKCIESLKKTEGKSFDLH